MTIIAVLTVPVVSIFHLITSSYSFTSDGRWMRFGIGRRDAACANSTLASYYQREPQVICGQGIELTSPELAVKEGASVERNNVRMSYIHS